MGEQRVITEMAETIRWTRDGYPILPAGRQFRAFVIAARQDGIEWRGEDFEHFQTVVTETERMRKMGVEAYKAMALEKMRGLRVGKP